MNQFLFQEANINPAQFYLDSYFIPSVMRQYSSIINSISNIDLLNGVFQEFDVNDISSIKVT